ncbi:hypothetical protein DFR58_1721 [Anaerobacterium chartisolvens]|uniref:Uncharacterized protein n=1 Tax=Anaerobacterium chartisolvens TaxID=1297424 RepID=A0A369ACF2_9FIRM|nr:hypothetical protein DFR58_1721 [Anaerobacterium chartisolvens]
MGNDFSSYSIKNRIRDKLEQNPELMYHINNPFLQKYIDIIIDSICEEISKAPKETIHDLYNSSF